MVEFRGFGVLGFWGFGWDYPNVLKEIFPIIIIPSYEPYRDYL